MKTKALKVISAAIVFLVLVAGVRVIINPVEKTGSTLAEELLQCKTDYVGNASKVGAIVTLLDCPDKLKYDHIELHTDAAPYGVTVHFNTDSETGKFYREVSNQQPFEKNAIIMFSLIGNVENINYRLIDGTDDYIIKFSRQGANEIMSRDVREFSQGKNEFEQLLQTLGQKQTG